MNRVLPPSPNPARLVVLVSGGGSNLQAVLDACSSGLLPAEVVSVFSNRAEAYGLTRAKQAGVPAVFLPQDKKMARREYDSILAELVQACKPDWVLLLGWMRVLTTAFLDCFPGRVVNLHPALPGVFPGTHAIERAFEAFQKSEIIQTGIMFHFVVDEGVDCGPVLAQQIIPIHPDDRLEDLEARIHQAEHVMVVAVMKQLLHRSAVRF
ncbi:MAG: phosphoribosylglycinamide formyltransferase [Anaerolineaceae bacterium]|nr:phosphoribosylglycinamide formyltransferase [Anaerolineaceae bacterium]